MLISCLQSQNSVIVEKKEKRKKTYQAAISDMENGKLGHQVGCRLAAEELGEELI